MHRQGICEFNSLTFSENKILTINKTISSDVTHVKTYFEC